MRTRRSPSQFVANQAGAVAPTYAIALTALVAIAGVGFDYGRMASLDTELQNATDQAALAAASQLDGKAGACDRAANAARTFLTNNTRFANDAGGDAITFASETGCDQTGSFRFYSKVTDTAKTPATGVADAHFVEVVSDARFARFALTPIVSAFNSNLLRAFAIAGLGSSVCKVPPLFMCNPLEETTIGADFPTSSLIGAGIKLVAGNPTVPGNFGFLDTDGGDNSTPALAKALGWTNVPADCSPIDEIGLKPGQRDVVFGAFNTRFDIDENGNNTCPSGGSCPAALNTRKDLVRKNQCGTNGNNGWQLPDTWYQPTANAPITSNYPDTMGYPRDICHSVSFNGVCSYNGQAASVIGDKVWDRDAYFRVNYGYTSAAAWQGATGLPANATRSKVYDWELADPTNRLTEQNAPGGTKSYSQPVCRAPASASDPDRRRASMAVVNCKDQATKISGNQKVTILKYVDVFYVEPAFNRGNGANKRTGDDQIYVEVVGDTDIGGGKEAQVIRRDVPYLIR